MALRTSTVLLIFVLLLASCTTTTPAPTATPTALAVTTAATSTAVAPSATPASQSTPVRPAATYPARPTATPYKAADQSEDGTYANADYGLKLRYSTKWNAQPPDKGSDVLQYFFGPSGAVIAGLLVNPASGDSIESVAGEIHKAMLSDLKDMTIHHDEAAQLADGRAAWTTLATAKRSDGTGIKINLVTALSGGRAYTLFTFGEPADYDK